MSRFHTINVPQQLVNRQESLEWLTQLAADTIILTRREIVFDFTACTFFAGNLCAVLGGIINGLDERGNKTYFNNLQPTVRNFLGKNQFLRLGKNEHVPDTYDSTIAFAAFKIEHENEVKEYVEKQLLGKKVMPLVTDALKKEMVKSIFEIYVNALTHGKCEMMFSCGQHFPQRTNPELHFTIVDLGMTIKNNVALFLKKPVTGIESIVWATSASNSTKTQNHSGGLGLKLIQEFIKLNKGALQIVSDNGIWEYRESQIKKYEMNNAFPGTIVTLVFNLKDTNLYGLASETTTFQSF